MVARVLPKCAVPPLSNTPVTGKLVPLILRLPVPVLVTMAFCHMPSLSSS